MADHVPIHLDVDDGPVPFKDTLTLSGSSFLGWSQHRFWHWNTDGTLRVQVGTQGQGPGEFQRLDGLYFDGQHYWALDAATQQLNVFSAEGEFLYRHTVGLRHLIPTDAALFAVDPSRITMDMIAKSAGQPQLLRPIRLQIKGNDRLLLSPGPFFHKATQTQAWGGFSFKKVFITTLNEAQLMVVPVMEPTGYLYEIKAVTEGVERQAHVPTRTLPLSHWQSETSFRPKDRSWWQRQSRINAVHRDNQHLVVGYLTNDTQYLQVTDLHLRPLMDTSVNGAVIGAQDGKIYFWDLDHHGKTLVYAFETHEPAVQP